MANPFYNPTGNPGTGATGLSALMRAEFVLIAEGFNLVPAIVTTGNFTTTFNQTGDFTFNLPAAPGTLAMLSDVANETTRARAAETANATAITTETTSRTTAVSNEATTRAAADTTNATAIATETTNRTTAVSNEATTRATADATNATAISNEVTRAEAAEVANATAITNEATARIAAVSAEATTRSTADSTNAMAITTETARAEAVEAAITLFGTRHDVTATRVAGTTYTNTTGKPMFVMIRISIFNTGPAMNFLINGLAAAVATNAGAISSVSVLVLPGDTYATDPNTGAFWSGSINSWLETW